MQESAPLASIAFLAAKNCFELRIGLLRLRHPSTLPLARCLLGYARGTIDEQLATVLARDLDRRVSPSGLPLLLDSEALARCLVTPSSPAARPNGRATAPHPAPAALLRAGPVRRPHA
jgi:hypothetical protein